MTDNNLSKLLDKGLIRVKKRKSPKKNPFHQKNIVNFYTHLKKEGIQYKK